MTARQARSPWYRLAVPILGVAASLASAQSDRIPAARSIPSDAFPLPIASDALQRGADWLLNRQDPDGGWRSTTYGNSRGGAGTTALAVYALSQMPRPTPNQQAALMRGLQFVTRNLDDDGFVRAPDGSSDYPTYATALVLLAMARANPPDGLAARTQMAAYLQNSQIADRHRAEFGGWSQMGGKPKDSSADDPVGISATRFALEALRSSGKLDAATRRAGRSYLNRCDGVDASGQPDGGYGFTPAADHPLNKAGWAKNKAHLSQARSYDSATADGLCALLALGMTEKDPRAAAAIAWLQRHSTSDDPDRNVSDRHDFATLQDGLRYYHHAAFATAIRATPGTDWSRHRRSIMEGLIPSQQADGSWSNPCPLMREDDPLVATSLAMVAMSSILPDPLDTSH